jgi:hypothetical protein
MTDLNADNVQAVGGAISTIFLLHNITGAFRYMKSVPPLHRENISDKKKRSLTARSIVRSLGKKVENKREIDFYRTKRRKLVAIHIVIFFDFFYKGSTWNFSVGGAHIFFP